MTNVVHISRAKSFAAPIEDRYVDAQAFCHYFSVSYAAAKNYARGFYYRGGEKIPYPNGPIPHIKTPGGLLRFSLRECEEWLSTKDSPVQSVDS